MSVYIGAGIAVGLIGVFHAVRSLGAVRNKGERGRLRDVPLGRVERDLHLGLRRSGSHPIIKRLQHRGCLLAILHRSSATKVRGDCDPVPALWGVGLFLLHTYNIAPNGACVKGERVKSLSRV